MKGSGPVLLTERDLRRVAAEAGVDVRTVRRAAFAPPRSAATRAAIGAALLALGFDAQRGFVVEGASDGDDDDDERKDEPK